MAEDYRDYYAPIEYDHGYTGGGELRQDFLDAYGIGQSYGDTTPIRYSDEDYGLRHAYEPPTSPFSAPTGGGGGASGFGSDTGYLGIGETGYRAPTYEQFSPYLMTNPREQRRALTENYLGPFANQLGMVYPGIRPETIDEFGRVRLVEPDPSYRQNPGGGGYYEPFEPPGPNKLSSGTVGLYARDPQTGIHEYAHAWSFPRVSESDWETFDNRIDQYLSRPDPANWRLRNELTAGYSSKSPVEAYAEIARLAGGNLANVPPELREFYPWLSAVPGATLNAPPVGYEIPGPRVGRMDESAERLALDYLNMSPQKLEYARGLPPSYQAPFVRQAQQAMMNVTPEFLRAYGDWPRWLPRPR